MFERYNEKARQSIFFARYEASQFGSPYIEPEHLLLGILRADSELRKRLFPSDDAIEALRQRFTPSGTPVQRISTSVDLPVSKEGRRTMTRAEEESNKLGHKHIGPEHLLLGIVHEKATEAAKALIEAGFTLPKLRDMAAHPPPPPPAPRMPDPLPETARPQAVTRDLIEAARDGELSPLIGRERELDRVVQILLRRTRHNAALIGEPGVGKTAIIDGLAQRMAQGETSKLGGYDLVTLDASTLVAPRRRVETNTQTIVCIEGLFDLAIKGPHWTLLETMHVLEPRLARDEFQIIATGTPAGLRRTLEAAPSLARHFEIVDVRAPDEPEAIRIVTALLPQYEKFHGVVFTEGTAEAAVYASGRFLPHRFLPDRALDLIDEAAARVKLSGESNVTADKIAAANAARTDLPVEAVKAAWKQPTAGTWQRVLQALAAEIPVEENEWLPFLAVWLAGSSAEQAEKLAEAIRQAKTPQSE